MDSKHHPFAVKNDDHLLRTKNSHQTEMGDPRQISEKTNFQETMLVYSLHIFSLKMMMECERRISNHNISDSFAFVRLIQASNDIFYN